MRVQLTDTITNNVFFSEQNGAFAILLTAESVVEVALSGYETQYFKPETLTDTIRLYAESRLLDGVNISSSAIKPVVSRKNLNVIDYVVSGRK